jgi:hypothetical protein
LLDHLDHLHKTKDLFDHLAKTQGFDHLAKANELSAPRLASIAILQCHFFLNLLQATKAGCPIQAVLWLEWDTTSLDAPLCHPACPGKPWEETTCL